MSESAEWALVERPVPVRVRYLDYDLDWGYRVDLLDEPEVVVPSRPAAGTEFSGGCDKRLSSDPSDNL